MRDLVPEHMANGTWVGIVTIRGDAMWGHAGVHLRSTEEGLSRAQVAGVAEAHVHQVPVSIDRPIEILSPSVNPHIGLVHVPTGSHRAVAPLPQGLAQQRGELALPVPHGFMGEDHATLQKHFGQVPQT